MDIKHNHLLFFNQVQSGIFFCILIVVFFISSVCEGQDKIYLKNEQRRGKVIEITTDKVKYRNPDNLGPVYSVARTKVELLFNENGAFLVVQKLDSLDAKVAEKMIENFIKSSVYKPETRDKIFNIQSKEIVCTILGEDDNSYLVSYNDLEIKYDKTSVAAIIYKDGKHKIISEIDVAVDMFARIQKEKYSMTTQRKDQVVKKSGLTTEKELADKNLQISGSKQLSQGELIVKNDKDEKRLANEQKKARQDSIADKNVLNKKFNQALSVGKSFYMKQDYQNAKAAYLLADSLKFGEQEVAVKLDSINFKLLEFSAYDSLTVLADSLFSVDLNASLDAYRKIIELKPTDYHATHQFNYLQNEIAEEKKAADVRKKQELEKRYQEALNKAEIAVKEKNYEVALAAYNVALTIHPDNDFAKSRAKIMEYQVSQAKKTPVNNKN